MIGTYSSATLVGRTIAPFAGGIIITAFALAPGLVPFRMVYIAAFLASIPVFFLILRYREHRPGTLNVPGFPAFKESLLIFMADRRLRATALADMITYFAFGIFETFLPVYLVSLQFEAYQIGIIFAIQVFIIAATKPYFGRIADRIDKRIQIAVGMVVTGLGIAAVPFAATYPGFIAASAVFGLGMSLSTVATTAYVADIAEREQIGSSMGALSSIMDIGHASGPLVTGLIITLTGYGTGFLAGFILALVAAVIFVLSVSETY
jgi:MFS family permease